MLGQEYLSERNNMKVKSNFMGNDTKIKANTIVVVDNNKAETLDNVLGNLSDLDTTNKDSLVSAVNEVSNFYQKTANGFVLKFPNGFMIQKKILTKTTVNCNQRANENDTLLYLGTKDMGKWNVPFTKLFDFTYTIGTIYGERMPWLASNTWNKSASTENKATTTGCGIVAMYLNWGAKVTCDLTCTGFGLWK